jgi:hypothetical protein
MTCFLGDLLLLRLLCFVKLNLNNAGTLGIWIWIVLRTFQGCQSLIVKVLGISPLLCSGALVALLPEVLCDLGSGALVCQRFQRLESIVLATFAV